jgi:2-aminobenzoylacetyl-CoA thioesterase
MEKLMIKLSVYKPIPIAGHLYRLGTPAFPVYLSLGREAMIIEGGISAIYPLIIEQLGFLKIAPERIKYLALTHTHADHIGAAPYLKKLWPHMKIIASPAAKNILENKTAVKEAIKMDHTITQILQKKHNINDPPEDIEDHHLSVDISVKENDRIDLGDGIIWTVCETTGHSSCHTSYLEIKEGVVSIGDATGFYVPEKDIFWPNYFDSLQRYCESIVKLYNLPANKGFLSHNYIIQNDVKGYLQRALKATENFHHEMLERTGKGEDHDKISYEKAKWVNTLTDDHPFSIMVSLSKVLVKRSISETEFDIPHI